MADDIAQWLEGLGLGQYARAFGENDIELDLLAELSDADLKEIGVVSLGHRRRILATIAGRSTGEAPTIPDSHSFSAPAAEAERRQLTVLFCDLVGSTALSGALDPEDYRSVIRSYQEAASTAVARYDGHVAKYLGDGLLAYFGWPRAHEDDAERAVRAGLDVVDAIAALTPHADLVLEARVGIATGAVVVGDLLGDGVEDAGAVSGETPNLAARLQEAATPGSVVIAETTRRLLGGLYQCEDLGAQEFKGLMNAVRVWRVVGECATESRFDAAQAGALTPFIGREHEIALLLDRWERAKEGEGQVVLLSGEAGIGKSRIAEALLERVTAERHTRLRFQCSPHYESRALHPFITQLERAAGFATTDDSATKLEKLEMLLDQSTKDVELVAPLFAELLSLPVDRRYAPLNMAAQRQKEMTLEALVEQLMGLAERQSVLMIFEDVHWADPTTLEALAHMMDRVQEARVLAVITCRQQFEAPWHGHSHLTTLTLNRLTRRQCSAMVARVTGGKLLPSEVLDQIVAKTDGVPLFVEELTKTVIESELLEDLGDQYALSGPLPPLAIPATLQDSLMARLDRLSSVKEIAQIGAAIGREFGHRLLAAISPKSEDELQAALAQLLDAELIFRRGTGDNATYVFKHGLVQDIAYESMLRSSRQMLHQRIAQVLEQDYSDIAKLEPQILAHHYTEAGLAEPAIEYWRLAGERAARRSANLEAVMSLEKALALLDTLPADHGRDRRELDMRLMLGGSQLMARGHGAPEVAEAYRRALELSERSDDADQLIRALFGLWRYHIVVPNLDICAELAQRLQDQGHKTGELVAIVLGQYTTGMAAFARGTPVVARKSFDAALDLYHVDQRSSPAFHQGQDPAEACGLYRGMALWMLGFSGAARESGSEGLAHAQRIGDPFSVAHGHAFHAVLDGMFRNYAGMSYHASECRKLSDEYGFALWGAWGEYYLQWLRTMDGAPTEIDTARAHERTVESLGVRLLLPFNRSMLAEAYAASGRWDDALDELNSILPLIEASGERWWEAEVHRLRGEFQLKRGEDSAAAESHICQALEIARRQQAKSLELRAAISLARLWHTQAKSAEARDVLAPIYGWFSEGSDTADLKEARALLGKLN